MEDARKDPKLAGLAPEMKARAIAVLTQMQALAYDVHIAEGVRTLEEQKKKVEEGYSKTLHSRHLTGHAVDVVDRRWGWNPPSRKFWFHLGAACIKAGLAWGGFFGLTARPRATLRRALVACDFDKAASMKLGWDPAHCEVAE